MDKKQEAEQAWSKFNKEKSSYEHTKAPLQSSEDAEYIQAISYNSRQYGIEDFKLALKAKIEGMIQINQSIKRLSDIHRDGKTIGLMIALASIDEVKPIQK